MLPDKLLVLSAFAGSSAAHLSPVPLQSEPHNWSTPRPDRSQVVISDNKELSTPHNSYRCYIEEYPPSREWLSWDVLWDITREQVLSSNGGDTYIQHYVGEGILQVAAESDVDSRLILAIVIQETKGKIGGKCEKATPCETIQRERGIGKGLRDSILGWLRGGIEGYEDRPGLKELLRSESSSLRAISNDHHDHDSAGSLEAETRYASDVANRLLGWDG